MIKLNKQASVYIKLPPQLITGGLFNRIIQFIKKADFGLEKNQE